MARSRLSPYFSVLAPLLGLLSCQEPAPYEEVEGAVDESSDVTAAACAHDPCVQGVALVASCEPCAGTVCAADSFCCTNSWDSICVNEAKSLCGTRCSGGTAGSGGSSGAGGSGAGGSSGAKSENTNALCSDGVDNDGDTFIDCADFNCSKNAAVTVCGGTAGSSGTAGSGGSGAGGSGAGGSGAGGTGGTGAGGTGSGGTGAGGSGGSSGETVRLRIMASNMTGNNQRYGAEAARIFQAIEPDVVAIQEFKVGNSTDPELRAYVDQAFGASFSYSRETGNGIPNGVISRYPILESGEWNDTNVSDRDFAYARIGLPNGRNLWAVSVHLLTSSSGARLNEATQLVNYIKGQVPAADLLVLGGDFNTGSRSESCVNKLGELFVTASPYPRDQGGNTNTNNSRGKPYDWLLADPDLDPFEVAVEVGPTPFPNGLVFDSRVFSPLSSAAPVISSDSSTHQHMGVVREFVVPASN